MVSPVKTFCKGCWALGVMSNAVVLSTSMTRSPSASLTSYQSTPTHSVVSSGTYRQSISNRHCQAPTNRKNRHLRLLPNQLPTSSRYSTRCFTHRFTEATVPTLLSWLITSTNASNETNPPRSQTLLVGSRYRPTLLTTQPTNIQASKMVWSKIKPRCKSAGLNSAKSNRICRRSTNQYS